MIAKRSRAALQVGMSLQLCVHCLCRAGRHASDLPKLQIHCVLDMVAAPDARVAGLSMAALKLCIQRAAEVRYSPFRLLGAGIATAGLLCTASGCPTALRCVVTPRGQRTLRAALHLACLPCVILQTHTSSKSLRELMLAVFSAGPQA